MSRSTFSQSLVTTTAFLLLHELDSLAFWIQVEFCSAIFQIWAFFFSLSRIFSVSHINVSFMCVPVRVCVHVRVHVCVYKCAHAPLKAKGPWHQCLPLLLSTSFCEAGSLPGPKTCRVSRHCSSRNHLSFLTPWVLMSPDQCLWRFWDANWGHQAITASALPLSHLPSPSSVF